MISVKPITQALRHGDKSLIAKALRLSKEYVTLDSQVAEPRKLAMRELLDLAAHDRAEFEVRLAKYATQFAQADEHEGRAV